LAQIKALVLRIRTENENLDRGTKVYATVKANSEVVVDAAVVASGEVSEQTTHNDVNVALSKNVDEDARFTIELVHPGIPGPIPGHPELLSPNWDPHWRMTFTVYAEQTDGKLRATTLKLESSAIYETKGGTAHLNFEGRNRSSGVMPFTVA
jgi:hypothetical protein